MSLPWMPLDIAAYRKDTAHLAAAEHGAYLLLIMHYWATGAVPDDDRQLARIAAMTPAEWKRARAVVQAFFHDGWKHNRIDKELARAADISSKRSASAKLRHSNSSANAQQEHTHAGARPAALPPQPHEPEETTTQKEARKRAVRLDENWRPTPEDFEYAHGKGLAHARIATEAEKFRNYWTAKSGKDATKTADKGWPATWRNWILNVVEREGTPNGSGSRNTGRTSESDVLAGMARGFGIGDGDVARPTNADIPRGRLELDIGPEDRGGATRRDVA